MQEEEIAGTKMIDMRECCDRVTRRCCGDRCLDDDIDRDNCKDLD